MKETIRALRILIAIVTFGTTGYLLVDIYTSQGFGAIVGLLGIWIWGFLLKDIIVELWKSGALERKPT